MNSEGGIVEDRKQKSDDRWQKSEVFEGGRWKAMNSEGGMRKVEGGNYGDKVSESSANNCLDDANVHNDPNELNDHNYPNDNAEHNELNDPNEHNDQNHLNDLNELIQTSNLKK